MSETQDTYHHGNLRTALIEAALGILRSEGRERLTLRAVTRAAGVSHTAPYKHFVDKNALLAAVSECGFSDLYARFEQVLSAADSPRSQLHLLGQAYVLFALDEPAMFRLMFSAELGRLKHQYPNLIAAGARPYTTMRDAVEGILSDAGADKSEVEASCAAAWSLVHGLSLLLIEKRIDVAPDEYGTLIDAVVGLFVRGLGIGVRLPGTS